MAAEMFRPMQRSQRGETLLESLIALVILATVAAAAYTGLQVAMRASAQHHDLAVAETLLRSAAERIQDPSSGYIPLAGCPDRGSYADLPVRADYDPIDVEVRFWIPPPADAAEPRQTEFSDAGVCPAEDSGLQQIHLSMTTPSGHTQALDILKRAD